MQADGQSSFNQEAQSRWRPNDQFTEDIPVGQRQGAYKQEQKHKR